MDTLVSGEGESPVYKLLAETVRSLAPTLEKANIASAAQVKIDNLADRMRKEVADRRGVVMSDNNNKDDAEPGWGGLAILLWPIEAYWKVKVWLHNKRHPDNPWTM